MTIEEMNAHLKSLGLAKTYRPHWDSETGTIELETRKPAQIIDGELVGSDICLTPKRMKDGVFRVWTGKKKKAKAISEANKITVRLLGGEAELFVPAALADQILPSFGAKVKKQYSPEDMAAMKARGQELANVHGFGKSKALEGGLGL